MNVLLLVVVVLGLGILPGAILLLKINANSSIIECIVLGSIFSNVLLIFGLVLSQFLGFFDARYIPSIIPFFLLFKMRTGRLKLAPTGMNLGAIASCVVSFFLLLPSAIRIRPAANKTGEGFYSLYVDIQYYLSIAAEVAHHVPKVLPYSAKTDLHYTWFFSGLIGSWSHLTSLSSISLLFKFWPVYFTILAPVSICIVSLKLFNRGSIAIVTTITFSIFGGPSVLPGLSYITEQPFFALSPTRDLATLLLLLLLFVFADLLIIKDRIDRHSIIFSLSFALMGFVLTGTKGSGPLLLAGGLLGSALASIRSKPWKRPQLIYSWIAIALGVLSAQVMVVRAGGSIKFRAFSPQISNGLIEYQNLFNTYIYIAIAMFCLIPLGLFAVQNATSKHAPLGGFLVGIPIAGYLGLAFMEHPGQSQLYFWQGAIPIVILCGSAIVIEAINRFRKSFVFLISISMMLAILLPLMLHSQSSQLYIVLRLTTLCLATLGFGLTIFFTNKKAKGFSVLRNVLVSASLATLAPVSVTKILPQSLELPTEVSNQNEVGGWYSDINATSPNGWPLSTDSVSSDYLKVLDFVRLSTPKDSLVIVNKHCISGSMKENNCANFWLMATAFSERRILSETTSYTYDEGNGLDLIIKGDAFLNSPDRARFNDMRSLGVEYVLIDKRETYSPEISRWGSVVFENDSGLLLKLFSKSHSTFLKNSEFIPNS
jgi:hypothetical protein